MNLEEYLDNGVKKALKESENLRTNINGLTEDMKFHV
jgi:hypothetical protein